MIRCMVWAALTAVSLLSSMLLVYAQQNNPHYLMEVDERLVRIRAVVFDKQGQLATGLTRDDFQVLDNGVPQRIVKFSNNLREPISVVLDTDVSQSMMPKLLLVREALDDTLQPFPNLQEQAHFSDEFSLVSFGTRAQLASPFLAPESLRGRIGDFIKPTKGSTALFDSIYLSVDQIERNAANQRQAIILVTDGGDNHSRYSLRETRKFLEEANVPIFAVMVNPAMQLFEMLVSPLRESSAKKGIKAPSDFSVSEKPIIGPAERRGPYNLKTLAQDTGGDIFTVRRIDELPDVVHSIAVALRYSYLLGYEMPEKITAPLKASDGRHKVAISLVPAAKYSGYFIDAKHGYYEGPH